MHAITTAARSFKYGAAIKLIINLLKFLMGLTGKKKPSLANFLRQQLTPGNWRLALSFFACTFLMRWVYCKLRRLRNCEDHLNSFVAGLAAGAGTMAILPRDNWHFILMLVSTRVFDGYYKMMIQRGWFLERGINYYVIFMLFSTVLSYGYFFEPDVLDPEVMKVYDRMAVLDVNERAWHVAILMRWYYKYRERGYLFFNQKFEDILRARMPR
jgi:hypothetical protein